MVVLLLVYVSFFDNTKKEDVEMFFLFPKNFDFGILLICNTFGQNNGENSYIYEVSSTNKHLRHMTEGDALSN